jgi:hypothetical protein
VKEQAGVVSKREARTAGGLSMKKNVLDVFLHAVLTTASYGLKYSK